MSDNAQWITLITVIVGFFVQYLRETRQRRWDKEDRAELAAKVLRVGDKLTEQIDGKSAGLSTQIADNTRVSTDAFREANSVNLKLQALGLEHNALQRKEQEEK